MINDYFRITVLLVLIAAVVMFFANHKLTAVATAPLFIAQIKEHTEAAGQFSWFRIVSWLVVFYVPMVIYGNFMTPLVYEPPSIPKKMRTTLSTLTKLPEELIGIKQKSPEWIVIYNNPKFLIDVDFCRENEGHLEAGCRIDITDFYVYISGQIWIHFTGAKVRARRLANIWIVKHDGSMVQDGKAHAYGYVFGNRQNGDIKVGFAETFANVKKRFSAHARHVRDAEIVKVFPLRSRREETAIRKHLEGLGANLNEPDEAGRELFDATVPGVLEYLNGLEEVYEETES